MAERAGLSLVSVPRRISQFQAGEEELARRQARQSPELVSRPEKGRITSSGVRMLAGVPQLYRQGPRTLGTGVTRQLPLCLQEPHPLADTNLWHFQWTNFYFALVLNHMKISKVRPSGPDRYPGRRENHLVRRPFQRRPPRCLLEYSGRRPQRFPLLSDGMLPHRRFGKMCPRREADRDPRSTKGRREFRRRKVVRAAMDCVRKSRRQKVVPSPADPTVGPYPLALPT